MKMTKKKNDDDILYEIPFFDDTRESFLKWIDDESELIAKLKKLGIDPRDGNLY